MSQHPHITPAELGIMKTLWKLGSATVRQVLENLPEDDTGPPAYTTVMTMMKNLAEKGALEVDTSRQPYIYTAAVRRDHVLKQRLAEFLHTVFDDSAGELVLHLADEVELSPEDVRRIEAKIAGKEAADNGSDPSGGGDERP
ncbi:MAG: BlaI/MecI/CopY family transcriptional regulator [Thermoanaerobaculales bacterium]|nr:BlaI/MecI/CopY family transcriptional regulator [Thermoanaerobaculales bacterium]